MVEIVLDAKHIITFGLLLDMVGAYFLVRTFKGFVNGDIQALSLLPMSTLLTDYTDFKTKEERARYVVNNVEATNRVKKIYETIRRDAKIGWWFLFFGFTLMIVGQYDIFVNTLNNLLEVYVNKGK